MSDFDVIVAGAGVIGLAVARELAQDGRSVLVLDAAEDIGRGTSSRNSEVVHAGIYYPAGSLKAQLCVEGRRRLYAYCAERGVPVRRLGKLIVAANTEQLVDLERIRAAATVNGVDDLVPLTREQALALEPALSCAGALLSPSTGIVDSHALMLSLQGEGHAAGAQYVMRSPVQAVRGKAGAFVVEVGGHEPVEVTGAAFVNAAGLHAPALARRTELLPAAGVPTAYFCKGSYAALIGRAPFSRLIYPVPQQAGLGVHLTLDLGGQARFGPDVEWVGGEDYAVDARRLTGFEAAVRTYWPGLPANALEPAYAGIRPKIVGQGLPAADFVIDGPREHGVTGLVNLYGIESPGLTSALAIASRVAAQL